MNRFFSLTFGIFLGLSPLAAIQAEPVIVRGSMVPFLLGTPVNSIRVLNGNGSVIPFQVDEITPAGEYVCPEGEQPNGSSADGRLDRQDEIAFLWEDADSTDAPTPSILPGCTVSVSHGSKRRQVRIVADSTLPKSSHAYLLYDSRQQLLKTPFYYAQFGKDRFHFTRAGIMDFKSGKYVDLTRELHIDIGLKTLFGLIPLHYSEESIVCKVLRYKLGPIRLIRRGDFYLRLGLGLKASRAIVYQTCYPQQVEVPVTVHLPVNFSHFFSTAYIDMTPVIRKGVRDFSFHLPGVRRGFDLEGNGRIDTLIALSPARGFQVTNGRLGFDWVTDFGAPDSLLSGSGFIVRVPSKRGGAAECGIRYTVRNLPKGSYTIMSRIVFPRFQSSTMPDTKPAGITVSK